MSNGTIKVKPWDKSQGDHVIIDEDQFDPEFHEKVEDEAAPKAGKTSAAKAKPAGQ